MAAETGKILYSLAGAAEILIVLILISRYIYLEPVFDTRRKWALFWGIFLFGQTALFLTVGTDGDLAVFWPLAVFGGYTSAVRDRHRARGFFLFLPVTGFLIAPVSLLFGIPYVLTGVRVRDMGKWELLFDLLFWVLLPLILWESREARRRFRAETSYRRLSRWERNLLHGTGLFLLAIGAMIAGGEELPVSGEAARGFTLLASVAAVLLEVSVTALVQQGNRRSYYQYMADLNRSYLRAELEHFEAHRESDTKLRMFRHDIRNHLLCIRELAARGNYSGLSDYIGELEGRLELTDTPPSLWKRHWGCYFKREKYAGGQAGHRDTAGRPPAFSSSCGRRGYLRALCQCPGQRPGGPAWRRVGSGAHPAAGADAQPCV